MADIIPGVHNYCDRWCERCRFIRRCGVGLQELEYWEKEKLVKTEEERQELFFSQLTENFATIRTMLEEFAEKEGVDLSSIDLEEDEAYQEEQARVEKVIKADTLIKDGHRYAKMVRTFVEGRFAEVNDPDTLIQSHAMGIRSEDEIRLHLEEVEKHASVIRFYCHFIPVKLQRAVRGYAEDKDDEMFTELEQDYNGTAKIAGIAVNRSILAWVELSKVLPELKDDVIPFLGILQKLQRGIKEKFPFAEQFVRPGFDTGHEP